MDQSTLVSSGHSLVREMDNAGLSPRFAMWVHNTDIDTWKLWLVPPVSVSDKREFYRRVSAIIAQHRSELGGIDASDTEMVLDTHPAVKGMKSLMRVVGLSNVSFGGNRFNGYYMPEGIVLRSAL